jgi:DNA-3-methyladenine glycosylase I
VNPCVERIFGTIGTMTAKASRSRCTWAENDPLLRDYHDAEWGVPVRDRRALWELLMLE